MHKPSTMTPSLSTVFNFCYIDTYEQDEEMLPMSKYDHHNMAQMVTPCNCTGFIGSVHLGYFILVQDSWISAFDS